jgi:hypothetical protein
MKGIFLSTVKVKDNSMIYAIAHGITVIDPVSPPVEHMLTTANEGSALGKALKALCDGWPSSSSIFDSDISGRKPAASIFAEYRFLLKRWTDAHETYPNA